MSTSAAAAVLAVDGAAMSVISTSRTAESLGTGMMYSPLHLAAGVPVHFHPLPQSRYLVLLRRRWHTATAGSMVGTYTDYEVDDEPSWAVVASTTGLVGSPGNWRPPTAKPFTAWTLNGAVSWMDFVYTVSRIEHDGQSAGLVSDIQTSKYGGFPLVAEEYTPTVALDGDTVIFDSGVTILGLHLVVFGTDADRTLYAVRKLNSRIGYAAQPWEFWTANGWSVSSEGLAPLRDAAEEVVTSHGPVSVAGYHSQVLLSSVAFDGTDYTARVHRALAWGRPWGLLHSGIDLGTADTYQGGTAYLQSHLGTNSVLAGDNSAGFPWVASVGAVDGDDEAILTRWGVVTLPRRG